MYSATRRSDNRKVALKFFGYTKKQPELGEIQKEVDLMVALEAVKGACQLLGVMTDTAEGYVPNKNPDFKQPYPILVMELLGVDLFVHLEERGDNISLDYLSQAFKSAMLGLQSIHHCNFLHRDLKIDNIVMASQEVSTEMKIIDFGLMIAVDDPDEGVVITPGYWGTPGYYAPETLLECRYSAKTDIWQAGCILYTLLSGFPPFHNDETANKFIQKGEYYPMDVEEWEVPTDAAKDLVRRMLTLDPAERIDMAGILSHPWLADASSDDEEALRRMGQSYKTRIKGLVFRNKLKRFFMSNNIEAGLLTNSKDAAEFYFSQFDTDRDGVIDFDAMSQGIQRLVSLSDTDTSVISPDEMDELFRTLDSSCSGKVTFTEFQSFYEAIVTGSTVVPVSIRANSVVKLAHNSSQGLPITRPVSEMNRGNSTVDPCIELPVIENKMPCVIS